MSRIMEVMYNIASFLSENNIAFTINNYFCKFIIYIPNILNIKYFYGRYQDLMFSIEKPDGLKLTSMIVHGVGLKDFSYTIDIDDGINLENIEFGLLLPLKITAINFSSDNITSFYNNKNFLSIIMNTINFINGRFNKNFPALVVCENLNDLNSILDIIDSHKVIIEAAPDKGLYKVANQLLVDGRILALIERSISCCYNIKYKNTEWNTNYSKKILKILMENKINNSTKSAMKFISE